jgi:HlyD family secretion protein
MTANLRIETDRRDNVVRIPNAALRWRPPSIVPDAAPAPAPTVVADASQGGPRGGSGNVRITEFVEAIKTELNLDAAQTKDVDAAIDAMRKSFAGNGGGGTQEQAARRERGRAARADLEERITAVLNAEQRTKFDEIKKRLTESGGARNSQVGRVFVTGKDGKPQGVTVRIGATDGGTTEIVSGLDAGSEVIIGGGPRADAATRGPRFGF